MRYSTKVFSGLIVVALATWGQILPAQTEGGDSAIEQTTAGVKTGKLAFKQVNVDNGAGVFVPAVKITEGDGTITIVKKDELGLTSSILYDRQMLAQYVRNWVKSKTNGAKAQEAAAKAQARAAAKAAKAQARKAKKKK